MSKIISIGKALPPFRHRQDDILRFMLQAYDPPAEDRPRMRRMYENSGIDTRYSIIPDYSLPTEEFSFYPRTPDMEPFPNLSLRMDWYHRHALELSVKAIEDCLPGGTAEAGLNVLITVSCTGLSAPGLDVQLVERLGLPHNIQRASVNFMGCYAAIHALKQADAICRADSHARVLIVCTELCTLHFQKEYKMDHVASGLLFGDGAAAVLVGGEASPEKGMELAGFYSELAPQGKQDMAWELSESGFLMRLSAYVPQLLEERVEALTASALEAAKTARKHITRWAVHPGGKKILTNIQRALKLENGELSPSFYVLRHFGNMSSPTILFVLKEIFRQLGKDKERIFGLAFGPGITMESFILEWS